LLTLQLLREFLNFNDEVPEKVLTFVLSTGTVKICLIVHFCAGFTGNWPENGCNGCCC